MCGFCGAVGPARLAGVEAVPAMARALVHRGPDDFGTWSQRFRVGDQEHAVALGHTRLAILDLSAAGHQPMLSADGSSAIAYNGEIYNFREVREDLVAAGHRFRSDCDTEVLLEAWRAWGPAALERLIGMFAFALWDGAAGRLVLARDRLGIKPLYYRFADGLLVFGSELGALRRHPSFRPEVSGDALARFLRYGYVQGAESIYAGVRRLGPGELLVWERGRVRVERFWDLCELDPEPAPASYADAVDRLEALLVDAVRRRLISDVPLGAFLSGGADSSTVVALMREAASGPVRTFSIGVAEPGWDEAPYARAVAEHLKTEHTELYAGRGEAAAVARDLPRLFDEPFGDSSAIPTVLVSRLARGHVTVVLSGDGGDELFGGYEHHRRLARAAPWLALPGWIRRAVAALGPAMPRPWIADRLRDLGAADEKALAHRLVTRFDERALGEIAGPAVARSAAVFERAWARAPVAEPARRAMFADAATYLPDDILTKVDRASMSVGLEARVPLLDHRVVRYALSLPLETTWRGGATKAPLRDVLYRRVPRELIERPKHGFSVPIALLLRDELEEWKRRYLDPGRLAEEGLLDAQAVAREIARAPAGRSAWYLVCFERWYAQHVRAETPQ
jgi:asparagine synthase (glutamine-hydrolysing)